MKVVTSGEMREIDRRAIQEFGIPGVVLMENAALKVFEAAKDMLGEAAGKRVLVFAGKGNNGGDGFAAARHLANWGSEVEVVLFASKNSLSGDALINFSIIINMGLPVHEVLVSGDLEPVRNRLAGAHLIIDAILGTGIKGTVKGPVKEAVSLINDSGIPVLSVDIPSGISGDDGRVCGAAVRADTTVTFGLPKRGHFLYPGAGYTGKLIIGDIGIPKGVVESYEGITGELITRSRIAGLISKRKRDAHKGTFGRVFFLAGSAGYTGAAFLACQGALKSGSGLVTLGVPESINPVMEVKLTEAMTLPLPETDEGTLSRDAVPAIMEQVRASRALGVGPGLSTRKDVPEVVKTLVREADIPLVLDADALNSLADDPDILKSRKAPAVITPHPGEMARLLGTTTAEVQEDRIGAAREAAGKWGVIAVLKGANTVVGHPDGRFFINTTGNPGMATGGTGDVLTGIITSFLGQGMSPLDAALAGVYIHGLAGDRASLQKGERGLTAGDIVETLPLVISEFEK